MPDQELTTASAPEPGRLDGRPRRWLALAVVATFWPALLGAYVADDVRLLAANPALHENDLLALVTEPMFGAQHGYWRPLTMLALWAGHVLGGAIGVHALALSLHAANACAVQALARRALPAAAATWVALVFVVHPVQVESVSWCSAINDPLWVAFALQGMLAVARWREAGSPGVPWSAGAAVLAAMLAKEPGAIAVAMALGAAWALPSRGAARGAVWRLALPLALAAATWLLLRACVHGEAIAQLVVAPPDVQVTAPSATRAAQVLAAQVTLLAWPWPLTCVRSLSPWPAGDWRALIVWSALAAGVVAAILLPLRPALRTVVRLAHVLIVLPLVPVVRYSHVIGVYPIADRYLYASVAGAGLAAWSLLRLDLWHHVRWVLPAALAVASFQATWNWHDSAHLTRHSLACAPDDPMVLVMAGDLELERAFDGEPGAAFDAAALYRRASGLVAAAAPGEQLRRAERKAALGIAWCTLLRHRSGSTTPEQVVEAFREAIALAPDDPMTWLGLGRAQLELRQPHGAEAAFTEALRIDPANRAATAGIDQARTLQRR